jgi:hypothetical protein
MVLAAGAAWSATVFDMAHSASNLRSGAGGALALGTSVVKRRAGRGEVALGVFGAALPLCAFLLVAAGQTYVGWPAALAIAGTIIVGAAGIWKVGRRKEDRVYSAMRELLPFLGASPALIR